MARRLLARGGSRSASKLGQLGQPAPATREGNTRVNYLQRDSDFAVALATTDSIVIHQQWEYAALADGWERMQLCEEGSCEEKWGYF